MTISELQSENERLRAELEEAKAETCACLKFLECELGWEDFRAEMLYASKPEPRSTSERNAEKLLAFLKEKGHGLRFLVERDALKAQCESLLGDAVKVADAEIERDEARAIDAALAEVKP